MRSLCDDLGMKISAPCVVSLTWRLEDAHGQLIDELVDPLEFFVGGEDLLAKVEEALAGHDEGFEATLHLEPEHAFGDYRPELVCFEDRKLFEVPVEEGMQLDGLPEGAATEGMPPDAVYTVTEVYDTHVVLDGNHPLAGVALVLGLRVRDVRAATATEIEQGTVAQQAVSVLDGGTGSSMLH